MEKSSRKISAKADNYLQEAIFHLKIRHMVRPGIGANLSLRVPKNYQEKSVTQAEYSIPQEAASVAPKVGLETKKKGY